MKKYLVIILLVSLLFVSAQCKDIKPIANHCCIISDVGTNEAIGCQRFISHADCNTRFGGVGNTQFINQRCNEIPACSGIVEDFFDYWEDMSSHNYQKSGITTSSSIWNCPGDASISVGDCARGGGSVQVDLEVTPNTNTVTLEIGVPLKFGSSSFDNDIRLYVDEIDKGVYTIESTCPGEPTPPTQIVLNNMAAYTADGVITVKISDVDPTTCDDPKLTYIKVLSQVPIDNCLKYFEGYGLIDIQNGGYGCIPDDKLYLCDVGELVLIEDCGGSGLECDAGTGQCEAIDLSLKLYMNFNAGTATDLSGNGNDGVVYGATYEATSGIQGSGAFSFNGVNDYISLGDIDALDIGTHDLTISLWFKNDGNVALDKLLSKGTSASTVSGYSIGFSGGELISPIISDGSSYILNLLDQMGSTDFTGDTIWHHVAWVIDRDGYSNLYIDGSLDATPFDISSHSATDINSNSDLEIGAFSDTSIGHYLGTIDEVRIYDIALNANEVQQLSLAGP